MKALKTIKGLMRHGIVMVAGLAAMSACLAEPALRTEKVVVLMRHGVRPQTNLKEIAPLSSKEWAKWSVADGMLTPHGAQAAGRLGAWEGRWLAQRGVLDVSRAASGCPAAGEVFAWSSRALQRTTDTGNAFLDAMFPGCGLKAGRSAGSGPDPLFTASETDVGRLDFATAKAAVLASMGGSFEQPKARLAKLHRELQQTLDCCRVEYCNAKAGAQSCRFGDLPWAIEPTADGRGLKLEGPLSLAATASQVFLLQYAEGMEAGKVAWGHAPSAADVLRFSEMRKIKYEYYERVPYLARRGASNILAQIALALAEGTGVETGIPHAGPPSAKYVLFVGSDTQIAQIGGMLDLHWQPRSYLADETPPTGGLVFERLLDPASGKRFVRVSFVTPTLDQIREAAVLDDANPPEVLPIAMPVCGADSGQEGCALPRFAQFVRERIDLSATAQPDYRSE